ncbi:hypothetical protein LQL77_31225 [Rhodococcus cerastii]|nr:hypothetical protein [Rhodococcus cerastii]
MNLRRHATILGIAAFGGATLLGAPAANAAETDTDVTIEGHNWGVNDQGWNFDIHNDSNVSLSVFAFTPFSNVDSQSGDLAMGHSAHVHGVKASTDPGPANVDFEFREAGHALTRGIAVRVSSAPVWSSKHQISVTATCAVTFSPNLECKVLRAEMDEPVQIVVNNRR